MVTSAASAQSTDDFGDPPSDEILYRSQPPRFCTTHPSSSLTLCDCMHPGNARVGWISERVSRWHTHTGWVVVVCGVCPLDTPKHNHIIAIPHTHTPSPCVCVCVGACSVIGVGVYVQCVTPLVRLPFSRPASAHSPCCSSPHSSSSLQLASWMARKILNPEFTSKLSI